MTATLAAADDPLASFLGHLARNGFQVGPRELLRANELLLALLGQGRLPEDLTQRMALLQPLLCRSAEQQRVFPKLMERWAPDVARPKHGWGKVGRQRGAGGDARRVLRRWPPGLKWGLAVLLLLLAIGLAVGSWAYCERLGWCSRSMPPDYRSEELPDTPDKGGPSLQPEPSLPQPAEPPGHLPITPSTEPADGGAAFWLNLAGGTAMLILLVMVTMLALRRLALQPLRTDARLDQRTLFAPRMRLLPRVPALLRQITRELRRPRRTDRLELDLAQTIAATVSSAGAFEPRYRARSGTPEYLVLIDQRGPHDQLAQVAEDIVATLDRQGVTLQAWRFNGDPAVCQPLRLDGLGRSGGRRHVRFGELAVRHAGQRLLLFADAAQFADPLSGGLREGLDSLASGFAATMLFTPQPVPGWGAAEQALMAQGVLVLPLQLSGLACGADWLSSQRALLTLEPDWPSTYPPRLLQHALLWTVRAESPPPDELDGLLFELQLYLGELRFQWLCGCATFPVPSWPVTLVLAPLFLQPGDDVVTGAVALAALPWFREGSWPQWLRQALLHKLAQDKADAVATELRHRLDAVSLGRTGEAAGSTALADVGLAPGLLTRLRRWHRDLWRRFSTDAWVARAPGRLHRDVLFLGFIQRGIAQRLIQRVPERLRRQVFREGLPLLGLRPWVPTTALLLALTGIALQAPPVRVRITQAMKEAAIPELPEVGRYAAPGNPESTALAFSPDGRWIAAGFEDGRVALLRRDGTLDAELEPASHGLIRQLLFSQNGQTLVSVHAAPGGTQVSAFSREGHSHRLDPFADDPGMLALSTDGRWLVQARPGQALRLLMRIGESRIPQQAIQTDEWPVMSPQPLVLAGFSQQSWLVTPAGGGVQEVYLGSSRSRSLNLNRLAGGSKSTVSAMALDRTRNRVAVASGSQVLVLANSGNQALASFNDIEGEVSMLAFRADGNAVIANLQNGGLRVLPLVPDNTGQRWAPQQGVARLVEFSADGTQLIESRTAAVNVWPAGGGPEPLGRADTKRGSGMFTTVSPNGRQIAVVGLDGDVRVVGESLPVADAAHWQSAVASAPAGPPSAPASASLAKPAPNVLGMNERTATLALKMAGFMSQPVAVAEPDFCNGQVLAQQPSTGSPNALQLSIAKNDSQFFALTCRGDMADAVLRPGGPQGFSRVEFKMRSAGTGPAAQGLQQGQCTWADRGFRPGEPVEVEIDVPAGQAQMLLVTLKDGGRYLTFQTGNRGQKMRAGCVLKTGVYAPAAPQPTSPIEKPVGDSRVLGEANVPGKSSDPISIVPVNPTSKGSETQAPLRDRPAAPTAPPKPHYAIFDDLKFEVFSCPTLDSKSDVRARAAIGLLTGQTLGISPDEVKGPMELDETAWRKFFGPNDVPFQIRFRQDNSKQRAAVDFLLSDQAGLASNLPLRRIAVSRDGNDAIRLVICSSTARGKASEAQPLAGRLVRLSVCSPRMRKESDMPNGYWDEVRALEERYSEAVLRLGGEVSKGLVDSGPDGVAIIVRDEREDIAAADALRSAVPIRGSRMRTSLSGGALYDLVVEICPQR
jgi:WD40 repeat protein